MIARSDELPIDYLLRRSKERGKRVHAQLYDLGELVVQSLVAQLSQRVQDSAALRAKCAAPY